MLLPAALWTLFKLHPEGKCKLLREQGTLRGLWTFSHSFPCSVQAWSGMGKDADDACALHCQWVCLCQHGTDQGTQRRCGGGPLALLSDKISVCYFRVAWWAPSYPSLFISSCVCCLFAPELHAVSLAHGLATLYSLCLQRLWDGSVQRTCHPCVGLLFLLQPLRSCGDCASQGLSSWGR